MTVLPRVSALGISILLGVGASPAPAAEMEKESGPWMWMEFAIVRSTADYPEARRFAEEAAARLQVPLDLRGLEFDGSIGLSFSPEVCRVEALAPHPCYQARGREGAATFVSVERSDAYSTFEPGLFVVVAATGEPDSATLASFLARARTVYPDAYVKRDKVYLGCMH